MFQNGRGLDSSVSWDVPHPWDWGRFLASFSNPAESSALFSAWSFKPLCFALQMLPRFRGDKRATLVETISWECTGVTDSSFIVFSAGWHLTALPHHVSPGTWWRLCKHWLNEGQKCEQGQGQVAPGEADWLLDEGHYQVAFPCVHSSFCFYCSI